MNSNTIINLTEEQKKYPKKVIESFFSDVDLTEIRESLSHCLEVALTTENTYFETPNQRDWIIYFYKRLEELIAATYLLESKKKPSTSSKNNIIS